MPLRLAMVQPFTKTFAPAVDINLEGNINIYSKAQSEFVLKDFFKKHPSS